MKAKEQAKLFLQNPDLKTLTDILNSYGKDFVELARVRRVTTTTAMKTIYDELLNKFQCFAKLTEYKCFVHPDDDTQSQEKWLKELSYEKQKEITETYFNNFMEDWIKIQDPRLRHMFIQTMHPISRQLII